ncbi:TPA: phosphoribosylformylglycinamidine cyclo-ligase [Patescibacteria group bacterium]|nr:phosphoribosylformylglycinamidine cyclo-ligase [Patescibacteria group bacterium]
MTYADTGVNYDEMDPFKRDAQFAARGTAGNITRLNNGKLREFEPSRGESAYLIEATKSYFAHVEEGLGTKNLVADAMYELTGKTYYDHVAQCTVAMIVNDIVTLGALPLSVAMHVAVCSSDWFNDKKRSEDLIVGWKNACNLARCIWGGGETPTLKGIVVPGTALLSGSAIGIIKPKKRLIAGNIQHGDVIVIFESSGVHANGLTLMREIASKLQKGYLSSLFDGRMYGETLLDPTEIYVDVVEDCLDACIDIHYAVNVTGHGWRKFMRATQPFTYVIDTLPTQLPIFDFIQERGPVDDLEAYGNLNMGAGFALYVPESQGKQVVEIAKFLGKRAFVAGYIEEGEKKVIIHPKNIEFAGKTLSVR